MENEKNYFNGIEDTKYIGKNIRENLKYCGEGVRIYPLVKLINGQNAEIDDCARLFDFTFIDAGAGLKVGKYSSITWYVLIEGGGKTSIGDRAFVGPGTKILTSTYALNGYYTTELLPEGCQKIEYGDVIIEDDAYIGANATIFPGSIIRQGAVVGANAFVKGELEPWTIYVGSPCKPIGKREKPTDERIKLIEDIDWNTHL